MMKTIENSYKEYITVSRKIGINDLEQTIYKFENKYRASVLEELNSNLFTLIEINPNNDERHFFFQLTSAELSAMLKTVKNKQ
ncbi:hypothetical protein E4S99_09285 [Listeria monocytogenes]|uniref:Uncharacterized protein n=1 Tax=Listeria monocytogenes TaxID=1639 RepID=A0AAN3BES9_LISMN|nr:hypothetical protein [Listeria monocytogenes]EAA0328886.1 hypothetical protein [Listeria monocytogenes]EAC2922033.1 hypothetical protein [Listeria monocytogenes]EAC2926845.1 hypothetical protein [Listeria monocytogenes]EAC2932841.1 hypothetical protein [Listeria monocytogenes]EAC3541362.1 hypothetical protein [Listeria monocytogenes]